MPLFRRTVLQGGLVLGLAVFSQASAPAAASAGLIFEFSDSINGAPPSSSPNPGGPPWLIATISNISGGVEIKLESRLVGDEYISNVGFNVDKGVDKGFFSESDDFSVDCEPKLKACSDFSFLYSEDNFSVDSGKAGPSTPVSGFDLGLLFGAKQFQGESTATITILSDGLNAEYFTSSNERGLLMAAKVQGIGTDGEGSGVISATEVPGPVPLLGAVAAFHASRRLRRRLATGDASPRLKA